MVCVRYDQRRTLTEGAFIADEICAPVPPGTSCSPFPG